MTNFVSKKECAESLRKEVGKKNKELWMDSVTLDLSIPFPFDATVEEGSMKYYLNNQQQVAWCAERCDRHGDDQGVDYTSSLGMMKQSRTYSRMPGKQTEKAERIA